MKKFLAIVLAAAMLLSILAGCGATKTEEPANVATDAAAAGNAEGRKELTMWFWGADDAQQAALAEAPALLPYDRILMLHKQPRISLNIFSYFLILQ